MTTISHSEVNLSKAVARLESADWLGIEDSLDTRGFAILPGLLDDGECQRLGELYAHRDLFRRHIEMARHGFGSGEYRYFDYPLPRFIVELRTALYSRLVSIANRWNEAMGLQRRYPQRHADFLAECHAAGQRRPTPLLLRYRAGDYNCLHQDLYGDLAFPLQVVILLTQPGQEHEGGEFVLSEQRPRRQSRVDVLPLYRGDAAILASHHRPAQGARGIYRVNTRHGVSEVQAGQRLTAGLIFHDAE
ncbi:proline hydroxylase [Halomonas huangheensis]|nr:proline hydroxylase [Halomonas huangheensis]